MFLMISNSSDCAVSANPRNDEQVRNTLDNVTYLFDAIASIPMGIGRIVTENGMMPKNVTISSNDEMILEQSSEDSRRDAFDPKRAMPSKHIISSLGSITNGFLFSTTPIILGILKELCSDVLFVILLHSSLTRLQHLLLHPDGFMDPLLAFYCLGSLEMSLVITKV